MYRNVQLCKSGIYIFLVNHFMSTWHDLEIYFRKLMTQGNVIPAISLNFGSFLSVILPGCCLDPSTTGGGYRWASTEGLAMTTSLSGACFACTSRKGEQWRKGFPLKEFLRSRIDEAQKYDCSCFVLLTSPKQRNKQRRDIFVCLSAR